MLNQWNIYVDANVLDKICHVSSPFNLKKDLKKNKIDLLEIIYFLKGILIDGTGGTRFVDLYQRYFTKDRMQFKIAFSKIRMANRSINKGKSSSFRIIILYDSYNRLAFVLHIYSKKESDNLTNKEMNLLRLMADSYLKTIMEGNSYEWFN